MRWPLRSQILVPLVGLFLATLTAVSGMNAYLAVRDAKTQIQRQLRSVADTLVHSTFPLTDAVLRQAGGLSGTEFVVAGENGETISSSRPGFPAVLPRARVLPADALSLDETFDVQGEQYFHAATWLPHRAGAPLLLHIFYPVQMYRAAWRHAVYPPLALGAIAILLAIPMGIAIAAHVTRPIARLRSQVNQIAEGNFTPMPLPSRDDEILDLRKSVNRMAEMLARYEDVVRRNERLKTLGQLGCGIAHQLRNSVTGCRMALDLHMRESPSAAASEELAVAVRQLTLMEKYLQRFLTQEESPAKPHIQSDLVALVEHVLPLVRPAARHQGIRLAWTRPAEPLSILGDPDAIEQLLVNLLNNAIDAAARRDPPSGASRRKGEVELKISPQSDDSILLEVADSGAGPPREIGDRLFEPLVTGRSDGTGLGLSVAREICQQHGGSIRWERSGGKTCFLVELPRVHAENGCVETVGRR